MLIKKTGDNRQLNPSLWKYSLTLPPINTRSSADTWRLNRTRQPSVAQDEGYAHSKSNLAHTYSAWTHPSPLLGTFSKPQLAANTRSTYLFSILNRSTPCKLRYHSITTLPDNLSITHNRYMSLITPVMLILLTVMQINNAHTTPIKKQKQTFHSLTNLPFLVTRP